MYFSPVQCTLSSIVCEVQQSLHYTRNMCGERIHFVRSRFRAYEMNDDENNPCFYFCVTRSRFVFFFCLFHRLSACSSAPCSSIRYFVSFLFSDFLSFSPAYTFIRHLFCIVRQQQQQPHGLITAVVVIVVVAVLFSFLFHIRFVSTTRFSVVCRLGFFFFFVSPLFPSLTRTCNI